jgi:hypothetical protein
MRVLSSPPERVAGELHKPPRGHQVRRKEADGTDRDLSHPGRRHPQKRRWLEDLAGVPEGSVLLFFCRAGLCPRRILDYY